MFLLSTSDERPAQPPGIRPVMLTKWFFIPENVFGHPAVVRRLTVSHGVWLLMTPTADYLGPFIVLVLMVN